MKNDVLTLLEILWGVSALVICVYPLVTGRMRFGTMDSPPILRSEQPGRYWGLYAMSLGLFGLVSAGAAWFVSQIGLVR